MRPKEATYFNKQILHTSLEKNLQAMKAIFNNSSDCIFREFTIAEKLKAALIIIDGLINKETLHEDVIKPLMFAYAASEIPPKRIMPYLQTKLLTASEVKEETDISKIIEAILAGDCALLVDNQNTAIIISVKGFTTRSVAEPTAESVIRGPREGFTEALRTNTSLLRRKIKNPNLVFETLTVGVRTNTLVNVVYVKGLAKKELINEVKRRIQAINIDQILDAGYIEQLIEDNPLSIFATIGFTEKPDVLAAKILEGRVGVLVDGSPNALTIPLLFIEKFQTAEDYYARPFFMSLIRLIRYLSFLISIVAPAYYIVLTSFHIELLPTPFLISIAASTEGTPFPVIVEITIMGFLLEVLREAGVRMPRPVGQAVSIVGALVIGEAAVSAGLVAAPLVIVVAVTAITSFIVPALYEEGALLRIFLILIAAFFGLIGLGVGFLLLLVHLASLRSFGVPFMSPIMPLEGEEMKDTFIRAPLWLFFRRPKVLNNTIRLGKGQMPKKERDNL